MTYSKYKQKNSDLRADDVTLAPSKSASAGDGLRRLCGRSSAAEAAEV